MDGELQTIHYGRLFPWVHLFRGFRIAIDFRKMILGGIALSALAAGDAMFLKLPFAPEHPDASQLPVWPWQENTGIQNPRAFPREFLDDPAGKLFQIAANWRLVLRPMNSIVDPARVLFSADVTWSAMAHAWTRLLWALVVWSLFGAAITRMAAVQFARDEKIGLRAAIGFAIRKFPSNIAAPLLPALGIGLFWLLCLVGGLIGRIPYAVGPTIVGILFFVALAFGFVMTLILLGVAAGWPLMFAAIGTEGSDGFDAFSRTFSYVYSRPWQYLWNAIVAMTYGSAVIFFVAMAASLIVYMAGSGVASGMGPGPVQQLLIGTPEPVGGPNLLGAEGAPAAAPAPRTFGWYLVQMWLRAFAVIVVGFVASYFWTATTIIYFLLRRSDDATDLDEVHMPNEQEQDDLLPLVGVAKSDQPIVVRPPAENQELDTSGQAQIYDGDTELDIRPDEPAKG